jgi:hypothetical protein
MLWLLFALAASAAIILWKGSKKVDPPYANTACRGQQPADHVEGVDHG